MKFILALLLIATAFRSSSQALEIRAGHSLTPSDFAGLRYELFTPADFSFTVGGFLESSETSGLHYTNYGLDLMAWYYTPLGYNTDHAFELRAGLGLCGQLENEPWVYKDWSGSKRMTYGPVGEVSVEYGLSESINLSGFAQQKYLFNSALGNTRFAFGLGIKIKFLE